MTYTQSVDDLIINIVHTESIAEQSDLQQFLKQKKHDIPQATLSRKLKKLNIVKVNGRYQIMDYKQPGLPLVLNIQASDFGLIVLQTHPGNASSLAYYLDRKYVAFSMQQSNEAGILGTIAGDDTVLVIVQSKEMQAHVLSLLKTDFPYL